MYVRRAREARLQLIGRWSSLHTELDLPFSEPSRGTQCARRPPELSGGGPGLTFAEHLALSDLRSEAASRVMEFLPVWLSTGTTGSCALPGTGIGITQHPELKTVALWAPHTRVRAVPGPISGASRQWQTKKVLWVLAWVTKTLMTKKGLVTVVMRYRYMQGWVGSESAPRWSRKASW